MLCLLINATLQQLSVYAILFYFSTTCSANCTKFYFIFWKKLHRIWHSYIVAWPCNANSLSGRVKSARISLTAYTWARISRQISRRISRRRVVGTWLHFVNQIPGLVNQSTFSLKRPARLTSAIKASLPVSPARIQKNRRWPDLFGPSEDAHI